MFSLPFRIAEYIGRKKRNGMTLFAYAFYTLFCLSRYGRFARITVSPYLLWA